MMWLRVTDLPTPERPIIATVWPPSTKKLESTKMGLSNVLYTCLELYVMGEFFSHGGSFRGLPGC